jgi:DNA-binding MarR family transcriptional regulator
VSPSTSNGSLDVEPHPPALARLPGYLVLRVAEFGQALFASRIAPLGVAEKPLRVLVLLKGEGPQTQSSVSRRTRIDKATMVRVVDELEARGLCVRRPNPVDARSFRVSITPKGRRLVAKAERIGDETSEVVFGILSPAERALFHELIQRIADNLPLVAPGPKRRRRAT